MPIDILNSDILLRVFEFASESPEVPEKDSDAALSWSSTAEARYLSLVCRAWSTPAQIILFRSVHLVGSTSAVLFLRTLSTRKDLARQTHRLSVALSATQLLGHDRYIDEGGLTILPRVEGQDWGQASTSLDLVRAVNACTSLRHLRMEPLHSLARESLLIALSTKSLLSLIIPPQISDPIAMTLILISEDLPAVLSSSLKHIQLHYHTQHPNSTISPFNCLSLTTLILELNIPAQHYLSLLNSAAPTLQVLHLTICYGDNSPVPAEEIATWSLLSSSLERLHINPCPAFLPALLPDFEKLIIFSTTTMDSQVNYIFDLPPNLNSFVLYDILAGEAEETWHRLLWCIKAKPPSRSLTLITLVDDYARPEELFFGLLTVEKLPEFTLNDFLDW